jgi:SAM-dependent methyltransferase
MRSERPNAIVDIANNQFFSQEEVWSEVSEGERQRIEATLALFPPDVRTILNVGCGDGRVTRSITDRYKIVGVDVSMRAASLSEVPFVLGSIAALPFADRAFDLVVTTEVLEHLPPELFASALNELQRVARRYILITVPNNEILEANYIKCESCQAVYHAWYHMRAFDEKTLVRLLSRFSPLTVKPIGPWQPLIYRWPYRILHYLGDSWACTDQALCPECLTPCSIAREGNLFGSILKRVLWRIYQYTPLKKQAFLGAVYMRDSE